ncbi:DUF86 domain-containing protein [Priestia koreensis]|uniref:DUF86 domain-containing protein n=1 Tax=Priestia koreensis TaxID=284581 RepID=UPI0028F6FE27|nr:DUF86 domain-containing protein [Priestia koreensis]
MYFVDRDKIEERLQFLEATIQLFNEQKGWTTPIEIRALERIGHIAIDAILDVGNAMIDGFIMRDPGSYEDIIDIMMDEKVVSNEEGNQLKEVIFMRKQLVQDYTEVDHSVLEEVLKKNIHVISAFPVNVRAYLENELGPVSAFKS